MLLLIQLILNFITDKFCKNKRKNYFYKIQVFDNCNNPGVYSNISKTIVLKVKNDDEDIFNNSLSWDDYSTWLGGVESFNIYRAVNGIFNPVPIVNIPFIQKITLIMFKNLVPLMVSFLIM